MHHLITLAAEPIRLATGEPETAGPQWWLGAVGAGALLFVIAGVLVARYVMMPPEERAFADLAQGMRLPKRHRRIVRELAGAVGAAPVALLLSEGAFHKALRERTEDAPARRRAAVLDLQRRVFGTD